MNEKEYWFVSHCSKDIQVVDQIVDILKNCNISYWKAPEMIPAGSNYAREIPQALKNCSVFLFIISEASQNSIWVEKEVDIAINCRKKIIPIKIDEVPLNDMYRFYLNNIQTIDVFVQSDGAIPKEVQKKLSEKFLENTTKRENLLQKERKVEISDAKIDTRSNAFRVNKIPMQCEVCGTAVELVGFGTYRCPKCNIDYYDEFQRIRNFLKENGPAPAIVIAKKAKVSKQSVESYFSENGSEYCSRADYSKLSLIKEARDSRGLWRSSYGKDNLDNRF